MWFVNNSTWGQELWGSPGKVLKVIIWGLTMDFSFSAVMAPNCTGIMASISPWHCRIGRFLLPLDACGTDIEVEFSFERSFLTKTFWQGDMLKIIWRYQHCVEKRSRQEKDVSPLQWNCDCTDGKLLWSGSQQLRATTPANWCWQVKAVYKDKAPPWGATQEADNL